MTIHHHRQTTRTGLADGERWAVAVNADPSEYAVVAVADQRFRDIARAAVMPSGGPC